MQLTSSWCYYAQMLTLIYKRMIWLSIFVTSPHLLFLILCCLLHLLFTPPYSPPRFLPLQRGGHMLQTCSVPSGWLPVILTPGESGSAGYKHREPPLPSSPSSSSRPTHTWAERVRKKHTHREKNRGRRKESRQDKGQGKEQKYQQIQQEKQKIQKPMQAAWWEKFCAALEKSD